MRDETKYRLYQVVSVLGLVFGGILIIMRDFFVELAVNTFMGDAWFFVIAGTLILLSGISGLIAFAIRMPMLRYFGYEKKDEISFRRNQTGRFMLVLLLILTLAIFLYIVLPFELFGIESFVTILDSNAVIGLNIGLILVVFGLAGMGFRRLLFEGSACPYCGNVCKDDITLIQHIEFASRFGVGHSNSDWAGEKKKKKKIGGKE